MPMTPSERARRAIVFALNNRSPMLVKITHRDANDPSITGFTFTPARLFDGTFADVGLTDDVRVDGFKGALADALPEIADKIQEDLATLQPGTKISTVLNLIKAELLDLDDEPAGLTNALTMKGIASSSPRGAKKGSKKISKKASSKVSKKPSKKGSTKGAKGSKKSGKR